MKIQTHSIIATCLLVVLWSLNLAHAQESAPELMPLDEQVSARFEQALADIAAQKEDIQRLDEREEQFEGMLADILGARRDRLWAAMLESTVQLAQNAAKERSKGRDVSAFTNLIITELEAIPAQAKAALEHMQERADFPTDDSPPEEFVVADQRLFRKLTELDGILRSFIDYVNVADDLGLDTTRDRESIATALKDSSANRSIFMELALDDAATLQATVATLPENTKLGEWVRAAQARVQLIAKSMQNIIALMNAMGMDTRQYRQQVLTVTGEITTDVLDVSIVANLLSEWGKSLVGLVAKEGPRLLFRLLLVAAILFAFIKVAQLVQKIVNRALGSARIQISHLLHRMIVSIARNLIVILGVLIAISQLGISLGPLLAGLGIAGFIIGFALQDSLSNFASGMMILLYRPFDVGDLVDAGGVNGKVSHMSLVSTTFMTLDNKRLVVPNNLIWGSVITNVTAQTTRRVDLVFGISYQDDIEVAEQVLREVVTDYPTVLEEPEVVIKVHELGDSSVNFIVRPWVKTDDYWDTYWDLTKAVKLRFDKEGISIPFPQRDVHVIEQKPA
jgi:small conductance mechanosensitive channel